MRLSWRLAILAIQLVILSSISWLVTGELVTSESWFLAGLLAVVINPQLLEPFYPKPADVIGNGLLFLFFYGAGLQKGLPVITTWAWHGAAGIFSFAIVLAIIGILFGLRKDNGSLTRFGRAARAVSMQATSRRIYSTVFLLSAVQWQPTWSGRFWILIAGWVTLVLIGIINWQRLWETTSGSGSTCKIEGSLGPSVLLVSATSLPAPGSWLNIRQGKSDTAGVVLSRIRRASDVWGQIHIAEAGHWEQLVTGESPTITTMDSPKGPFFGSVGAGSSEVSLTFYPTQPLEVGKVVSVSPTIASPPINYQVISARIERSDVKGGAQLHVKAEAVQLGIFDLDLLRLVRHRWVPPPGAAITEGPFQDSAPIVSAPSNWLEMGRIIGTEIPVYLDTTAACEGHLAILGMTKMGKTSFALRLAKTLADTHNVTILDQTGEWVSRRGIPMLAAGRNWDSPDVSVFEPKTGEIPAERALGCFRYVLEKAIEEYKTGNPFPRVFIIDEAHQFIPEPAGLGFNAPGRDSSYAIGTLMMQVRKYGLSVVLISQRTAVVAKSALSQCENIVAFRNVDQTGLDYLEAVVGMDVRSLLPQLKQGEALVFGPAISSDSPVAIKIKREVFELPERPVGAETVATETEFRSEESSMPERVNGASALGANDPAAPLTNVDIEEG
jgi:hypothetical protein